MDRISLETLHQTALLNSRNFNETQGRPLNPLRRDNEKVQTVWVFDPKKTTSCSGIPIAIFRREYNGNGDNCDAGSPNTCRISRNAMFQCGYGQGWDYADYFDQRSINTRARWIVNLNDYSCPQTGLFGATSAIASGTCVQNSQGSVLIACDSIYIYTSQCRDGGCSSQCTTYVAQQNVCSPIGYQACIVASNGPSWPFTSIDNAPVAVPSNYPTITSPYYLAVIESSYNSQIASATSTTSGTSISNTVLGLNMTIFVIIIVVLVILILAVGILFFVYVYRNKKRRVHDEEWPVKMPENVSQINLERVVLRTELGLKDSEMMDIVSDLTPLRHLKAERLSYIASLLAQLLSSFECVGYPAVDNPLISLLKIIAAESGTSPPHDSVLITPVARIYLERALATNFCLPQPLTLAKECVQSLELMLAALKKMEDAKKSAAESEEEFETRLLVLKAEMDKVCNDAEICMKDKMHELEGQIALLRAERDKFNSRALEAEATALMMEQKSKDEAIETRTRIRHLREELEDLGADELNMTDASNRSELLSTLEELIGEKVSRVNRLAAVASEFYVLENKLGFPPNEVLSTFLVNLPNGLPVTPSRRALQTRAKQIFMASLSATKGLPPPFVMTRSYIETLEDRRDEVRDLVMEREARLAECHRIAEEITNLWEQLNTPVENRINLDIDVNCLEKYQEMSRALRDQWQSARQGEADKERLQIVRNELIDLKDDEFQVQDFNSSQEVWATLERLVSEKVRRINHLANLAGELYMLYTTPPSPGIPENSLQDILLKSFLITLPGTLPSPLSLEALQGRTKELLTSSFTRNRALPEPLSIERKYALEIEAKINALKKTIKEKAEKEEQVRRLIIDIHALWDELSVPHKDRVELVEFVDKIKEYTTIAQKLRRKWSESKKREIDEAVARLKAVYEECGVSQEEQDAFWERNNPIYSPTSLAEMLKEIASVTMRKESGVKIYKAIEDRKEFLKKLIEFEKAAGDPSRLFSGSSLRLLEEEKLRKSALPTLKQMENRLRKMLNDYEEDTNYSFMLNGRPYVEILDEEVKARLSNSTILVFFSSKKS